MSVHTGLRVALVHDWLTGMRGGEKVLEAIAELFPGAPIHTLVHVPGSVSATLESHPIRTSFVQGLPGVERRYRHYLPLFPAAVEDFDFTGFDLVFSTSHCVAKGAIPAPGARHLCYCHSPIRYAWDQEHVYFPKRTGLVARLRGLVLSALRTWDAASSSRVDLFLANSRFVAERIRRYYGREAEVLHPPVDVAAFGQDSGEHDVTGDGPGDGYAVMLAALNPYKRVEVAIEACERLGLRLRVIGSGPDRKRLERLAGSRTELLGRVSDEELQRIVAGARYFVQPGVEDFGIAAVEALAAGVPVIARRRGGVLDIVEDGVHGILYDGDDADALVSGIDKARQLGFNKLELGQRACAFSRARFHERLHRILAREVPESEAAG